MKVISGGFMFDLTCYSVLLTTRGGFGKHIWAAPVDGIEVYFLGLFIAEYLFTISICLVKSSILAFYWRIFGVMRSTRLFILVTTFQCLPVSAFWLRFNPNSSEMAYKCPVDVRMFFIANAIPNNITDILLLLIPIPGIWSLQLRTTQKIAVSGIFALGLFVTTVSFVRLYYVVELDFSSVDITWLFSEAMMWTTIELNVGTVCGMLGMRLHWSDHVALIISLSLPSVLETNLGLGYVRHSSTQHAKSHRWKSVGNYDYWWL
ncbi:Uncharacterized protein HZ326_19418 [Fusarium oxysporum f. sp. albedinis]|nr:Uncharacterized protein HZ326_19418 [Fusarium oxysporum f. sp. albedinis]